MRTGGALEKWARVIMLAAAITVVVSVLLPWKYEDAFPNITEPHWSRGIDLDFVPAVPILGIVALVLGLLRRYEGVAAFGVLGAFLTFVLIGLLAGLGEPDEPEDVGAGAWLALFAWIVLVATCGVAWGASLKRHSP